MKAQRKIIQIDEDLCDGCGQCIPSCAEGAIEMIDGKARLVADKYCDGLGACLGECPTGALSIVERDADAFDEGAVEEFLASKKEKDPSDESSMPCGCPSAHIQTFVAPPLLQKTTETGRSDAAVESALSHWPVQIRLVPPTAPFLKEADLLVAADCTPVAYPHFHRDFVAGKIVLLGCPKFDDAEAYVQKFATIFEKNDIRSVTLLVMEVPCCQGLPAIVGKGMKRAGRNVPTEKVVISARGEILGREAVAA